MCTNVSRIDNIWGAWARVCCAGVVDESPEMAHALARAAAAALSALDSTGAGVGDVELAAVEPGEPLALPEHVCQQVLAFRNHFAL